MALGGRMITDEEERALRAEHAELIVLLRQSQARAWRRAVIEACVGLSAAFIAIRGLAVEQSDAWRLGLALLLFNAGGLCGLAWFRGSQQRYHAQVGAFLEHVGKTLLEGNIAALRRMPVVPGDAP